MSYYKNGNGNTILVSRQGYAGLGAYTANEMALPFCGDLPKDSTQICRSEKPSTGSGFGSNRGSSSGSSGGTLSTIGGFFGDVLKGAVNSFASAKGGAGAQPPFVQQGPSLMLPLAIGGLGLVALVLLTRRRRGGGGGGSAPTSNPARRRHRRHLRRRR